MGWCSSAGTMRSRPAVAAPWPARHALPATTRTTTRAPRKYFARACRLFLYPVRTHAITTGRERPALTRDGDVPKRKTEHQMDKLTYGDKISIDFGALPEASQYALASEGLTHFLGNRVASKVHAWAMGETQANSKDKATVSAWKESNAGAIVSKSDEFIADTLKSIADGTLGVRSAAGPRATPLETLKRQIAKRQVETILKGAKLAVPKGEDKIKTADGEFTMAELVTRRLTLVTKSGVDIGAAITKEAEKELKARAKAVADVEGQDITDLL